MRRFFIGVALTLLATAASAVPARRDIRIFTQSDGSTIALRLIGDETFHTYVTVDNLPVAQTSNGDFHYTTVAGISPIVAHNPGSRAIGVMTASKPAHQAIYHKSPQPVLPECRYFCLNMPTTHSATAKTPTPLSPTSSTMAMKAPANIS